MAIPIITWPAPTNSTDAAEMRAMGFTHVLDWMNNGGVADTAKFNMLVAADFKIICGRWAAFVGDPNVEAWIIADDVGYVDSPTNVDHSVSEVAAMQAAQGDKPTLIGMPYFFGYGCLDDSTAETAPAGYWAVNRGWKGNVEGDGDFTTATTSPDTSSSGPHTPQTGYAGIVDIMTVRTYGTVSWNDPTFTNSPSPAIAGIDLTPNPMNSHESIGPAVARARRLAGAGVLLYPEIGVIKFGELLHPAAYDDETRFDSDPTELEMFNAFVDAVDNGADGLIMWAAPYLLDDATQKARFQGALDDFLAAGGGGPGGGDFPVLASHNGESGTSLGTSNAQPAPSGVAVGDLLLAIATEDDPDVAMTGTWTQIGDVLTGALTQLTVWARVADGTGGDTLSISGDTKAYRSRILRITGHGVTNVSTDIEIATAADAGSVGSANPPSLDAGVSANWLWIAAGALNSASGDTWDAVPASYTVVDSGFSSNTLAALSVAQRDLEASIDNPGTFTHTPTRRWVAVTIAIPPGESEPPPTVTRAVAVGITDSIVFSGEWTAAPVDGLGVTDSVVVDVGVVGSPDYVMTTPSVIETPPGSGLFVVAGGTLLEFPHGSGLYSVLADSSSLTVYSMTEDPPGSGLYLLVEITVGATVSPVVWSVDLCRDWRRIGQLQQSAFEFQGVQRHLDFGEWMCAFPDSEPAWSSHNDPDLPNFLPVGGTSGGATTPDAAVLDVTGNIDVRWFGTLNDWDSGDQTLFNKWTGTGSQQSWILRATATGVVVFASTTGANVLSTTAVPIPFDNGAYGGIRFTRVQATGVTTTYFSHNDGASWVSAGSSVLSAGTALFNSSAALIVGGQDVGFGNPPTGRVLRAELWNGIEGSGGTVVASPNFSDLVAGFSWMNGMFRDAQLNPWTLVGFGAAVQADPDVEQVQYGPEDVNTIRLIADNHIEYAGYVGEQSTGSGGIERIVRADGVRWQLSGPDLWDVLRSRVALPDPTVESGWAVAYDERTGVASTVLAGYLSDNAGVTALADFQIDGFSVVDTVAGLPGTWSARLQPLDELTKRICDEAGLICRFTVTFAGDIIARIEQPRDLSETFVLSDQGDLVNIHSRLVPVRTNYVIAGGTGTGTSRAFRTASDGSTGSARRVTFSDQSSLSAASELQASANAALRSDAETWSVSAEVTDTAVDKLPIGSIILIGDSVSVEVNGRRHTVPVAAITWSITADRQVVRPTLGDAVPDALKGLLRDVANLESRFDNNVA